MFYKIVLIIFISQISNKKCVDRVRNKIIEKSKSGTNYSTHDINVVKTSDYWIESVIDRQNSEQKAVEDLDRILKWRKDNVHNEYTDQSFPLEIYRTGYVNFVGVDSQDRHVIWLRPCGWRNTIPKFSALMKAYLIYSVESALKGRKTDLITAQIFDGRGLQFASLDMDLYTFYARTLMMYYHFVEYNSYMLNFLKSFDSTEKWVLCKQKI